MPNLLTYPLNNTDYEASDAELYHSTRTSGVYDDGSFDLEVSGTDNSVIVKEGQGWIKAERFKGKSVALKTQSKLVLDIPDSAPRIDAIILEFDSSRAPAEATQLKVKKGTPSSSPVAPEVVRNPAKYELHLYHVLRNPKDATVALSQITDLRHNEKYCGTMIDELTPVDKTLTKEGWAADANAVGRITSNMEKSIRQNTQDIDKDRTNINGRVTQVENDLSETTNTANEALKLAQQGGGSGGGGGQSHGFDAAFTGEAENFNDAPSSYMVRETLKSAFRQLVWMPDPMYLDPNQIQQMSDGAYYWDTRNFDGWPMSSSEEPTYFPILLPYANRDADEFFSHSKLVPMWYPDDNRNFRYIIFCLGRLPQTSITLGPIFLNFRPYEVFKENQFVPTH